jgi:NitT/TauT family transport system permease protein
MFAALIDRGVGKMIIEARIWNDLATMVVGVAMIGCIGLLIDSLLLGELERRTIRKWGILRDNR